MSTTWDAVSEGMEIPTLAKNCNTQQLVHWAAASGDFYQIHYDHNFAKATGLENIIVHGALKHAFLGQLLHDWIGNEGSIKKVVVRTEVWTFQTKTFSVKVLLLENMRKMGRSW